MVSDGVNVFGHLRAESGTGEHSRLLVAAVKQAGIPYAAISFGAAELRQQAHFSDWGVGEPIFDINVVGVNADRFPHFAEHLGRSFLAERYTIALWAWETEIFPQWMAKSEELVDEVWANSSFSARAIATEVRKPVLAFPLPIETPRGPLLGRNELNLPTGFLFLFCFDFYSVFERKNPLGLIEAFRRAFRNGEGPKLLVKSVNGEHHPEQLREVKRASADRDDIEIWDGYIGTQEQQSLIGACDSYVSLHRSEGFGLTLGEAMALGKPVIATGYSGNLDFMTPANSFLVPYELIPIPAGTDPYPVGCPWADPDLDSAAELLRQIYEQPEATKVKTARALQDIESLHSPKARATFVARRLERIRSSLRSQSLRRGQDALNGSSEMTPLPSKGLTRVSQLLIRGPDIGLPSRFGALARALRWVIMRALQNYSLHLNEMLRAMLDALEAQDLKITLLHNQVRDLKVAVEQLRQGRGIEEERKASEIGRSDS